MPAAQTIRIGLSLAAAICIASPSLAQPAAVNSAGNIKVTVERAAKASMVGVEIDVLVRNAGDRPMRVMIPLVQGRSPVLTRPTGGAETGSIVGILSCSFEDVARCLQDVAEDQWIALEKDEEVSVTFGFARTTLAPGARARLDFLLLRSVGQPGGGRRTYTALPVALPGIALSE